MVDNIEISRKIRILIIDDDKDFCNFIKKNLQLLGNYKVIIAKGGNMGMWFSQCHWHKPDLILLDIMMPGMDGYEILRRLKKDNKTVLIPIIMLTAKGDISSKIKAEGFYCDDYLTKPVETTVLMSAIEKVLAKRGIMVSRLK